MKRLVYCAGMMLLALSLFLVPAILAQGQREETATVTSVQAPLHTEPSAQSESLILLRRGTLLTFLGLDESRAWAQVETPDGLRGWVSTVHVRLNGPYIPPADGLTRTVVDGRADDWERFTRPYTDAVGDSTGDVDIVAVRSFMNAEYLYGLVEVQGDPRAARLVLVDIVTNKGGEYATYQYALPRDRAGTLFVVTEQAGEARDASAAIAARDTAIEFRIPLALMDSPDSLNLVGVHVQEATPEGLVTTDELTEIMPAVVTEEVEPEPDGEIVDARVNFRAAPYDGRILRVLPPGEQLRILGRSEDSRWLLVRLDDTLTGWVSAEYVSTDEDIASLPVES